MSNPVNIHSTGLVLNGRGILLRGPSGVGKSLLTLELLNDAEIRGQKASLVADDRIDLTVENGVLIMHAPPAIGGLIELRGRGIIKKPHVESAPVHLIVDIIGKLVRLVEEDALVTEVEGVMLPRCPVPNRSVVDSAHQQLLVQEAIKALPPLKTRRVKKTA